MRIQSCFVISYFVQLIVNELSETTVLGANKCEHEQINDYHTTSSKRYLPSFLGSI